MAESTHVERSSSDGWPGHSVMFCGAVVLFDESGDVTPVGFDFFHRNASDKATCQECKRLALPSSMRARALEPA